MDLPPSGWYPDPYGTPSLLRWWDGSGWTQHTHPDVTAGGNGNGGAPAATAVQGAAVAATALQGTAVQATAVQRPVEATALQATTLQAAAGQPSAEWLSKTKPPTGPPTQPQPALPVSPGAVPAYQAAAAVSGAYQQTAVQPGYPQPGLGWGPGGGDGAGTQVLAPWQAPGMPGGPVGPGGPGGPVPGYGYQEAQRGRRRRLAIGVAAGAVVAIAAIAVIVSSLGSSPPAPVADQSAATSPAAASTAAASAAASVSASPLASPSASASPSAAAGGLVADSQSGLSYSQLPAPWQATASCPLNNGVFPWTDGEQAAAGQVNGNNGQVTWYGEACSGPLPQQYGYTGTADLQNAADSLASTFENAYYSDLNGSVTPGEDMPIQVSGHAGWEVSYDVSYPDASGQGATWNDERAAVVVIDNGTDQPAVFFTSVPSTLNEDNIATLVSSLQLNSSPAASGNQAATPAGGPGNGGNGGNGGSNP